MKATNDTAGVMAIGGRTEWRIGRYYAYINGVGLSRHKDIGKAVDSARKVFESTAFQNELHAVGELTIRVMKFATYKSKVGTEVYVERLMQPIH